MSIDNCLLPDENRVAVTSLTPTSNLNGELTLSSIEELEAGFKDNIVASVGNDPLTAAVRQYGSDIFYNNLNSINKVLTDGFVVAQVVNYETNFAYLSIPPWPPPRWHQVLAGLLR